MGKIKRERQKFHITSTVDDDGDVPIDVTPEPSQYKPLVMVPMHFGNDQNIFAGINIRLDDLNRFTETKPTPPTESAASLKGSNSIKSTVKFASSSTSKPERQLTKKEKMKLKHEKLLQKIDVIQQAKQKHKMKKQKTQNFAEHKAQMSETVNTLPAVKKKQSCNVSSIRNELVSLNDSLPSLDTIYRLKSKDAKTGLQQPTTLKSMQRKSKTESNTLHTTSIQCETIMKSIKKGAKKDYVKSYDLFRKLLKTAKTTSNSTKTNRPKKMK